MTGAGWLGIIRLEGLLIISSYNQEQSWKLDYIWELSPILNCADSHHSIAKLDMINWRLMKRKDTGTGDIA